MGYDLHITRAEFWAENAGQEISAEEWLELVDSDSSLSIDLDSGPYFAELKSSHEDSHAWLKWSEGNILTTYPDRATLAKMLEIAGRLDANVQGDDGERYTDPSEIPERPIQASPIAGEPDSEPAYVRRETRWRWIGYALVVLAVLAVNLLGIW